MKIAILSASVRSGRNSHRVALFLQKFLSEKHGAEVELLDLQALNFPIFEERLKFQKEPLPSAVAFSQSIRSADGVVIVSPEYNGSLPASLKNAIDLLNDEWRRKPVALAPVSAGPFGGAQATVAMVFPLWKIGAFLSRVPFPTPKVAEAFAEDGTPTDAEGAEKRAAAFAEELFWVIRAAKTA